MFVKIFSGCDLVVCFVYLNRISRGVGGDGGCCGLWLMTSQERKDILYIFILNHISLEFANQFCSRGCALPAKDYSFQSK